MSERRCPWYIKLGRLDQEQLVGVESHSCSGEMTYRLLQPRNEVIPVLLLLEPDEVHTCTGDVL
jgi:hypothetical protein